MCALVRVPQVEDGVGAVGLAAGLDLEAWDLTGLAAGKPDAMGRRPEALNRRYLAAAVVGGRRSYVSWDGHVLRASREEGGGGGWRWGVCSRRRDCHPAAPPSPFSRRSNVDGKGVSAN